MLSEDHSFVENATEGACPSELDLWDHALTAYDACDYEIAMEHFMRLGTKAKPLYNLGIVRLALRQPHQAVTIWTLYFDRF